MLTTKEQLEKAQKLKAALNGIALGTCGTILGSAALDLNTWFRLGLLGVNISANVAGACISKQMDNFDENGYITELNKIYNELLNEIVKLSKTMDNKELLEHYHLLRTMYLSSCLNINSTKKDFNNVNDEIRMLGALSLNNHGVCRHTSVMTTDFLKKLDYKSQIMVGNTGCDYDRIAELLSDFIILNPGNTSSIPDKGSMVKEIVDTLKSQGFANDEDITSNNELEGLIGNHAIAKANDKNNSYYLDMSLDRFYIKSNDGVLVSPVGDTFTPATISDLVSKKVFGVKPIKDKSSEDLMHYLLTLSVMDGKIKENRDIIEGFKKDNFDRLERAEEIYQLKRVK